MASPAQRFYQKMYRRGFGATLAIGLSALAITCFWILKVAPYQERFSLYFDSNIHGLSVGAPVLLNGRTVGQVEDIELEIVSPPNPKLAKQYYAGVTIQINSKVLEKFGVIRDDETFESALPRLIAQGLRGQLRMPSLLANGLSLDLYFDPDQPAKTVAIPDAEYPEIPAHFKSTSDAVDQINAFIESKNLFSMLEKIQKTNATLSAFCLAMENIDYRTLNEKMLSLLQKANAAVDEPSVCQELRELNQNLSNLHSAIADHRKISSEEIEQLRKSLHSTQQRLQKISEISREINAALSTSNNRQEKTFRELKKQCEALIKLGGQALF